MKRNNETIIQGLTELEHDEMKMVEGGLAPAWWAVIWSAVSNFGDLRQGFTDGNSGKLPGYGTK